MYKQKKHNKTVNEKFENAQARACARARLHPLNEASSWWCVCVCVISDDGWCGCLVLLSYAPEEVTAEEGSYCWSNLSVPGGHHTIAVFHSAISRDSN